jgi:hypothetical protein
VVLRAADDFGLTLETAALLEAQLPAERDLARRLARPLTIG